MTSNGTSGGWDLIVSAWDLDEHIPAWGGPRQRDRAGPPLAGRVLDTALGWKVLSEREREIVIGTDENAPVGI